MDRNRSAAHKPQHGAMLMRIPAGVILLVAALAAGPALAQVAAPSVPRGEAKAEGDALLAQAGAADLFDNVTSDGAQDIKIRHKASGLICEFNPGVPSNRLVVFDSAQRGDDIACSTGGEAGERTLYAVRAPG